MVRTGYNKGILRLLGNKNYVETAPSCRLIKSKFLDNPGHVQKCYPLCHLDTPQLLLRHHSVLGLELWYCPKCYKNILIRVQRQTGEQ